LKKLDAIADQAEVTSTTWLLERQIAHKAKAGGKLASNIGFTKAAGGSVKKATGRGGATNMFPQPNKSAIASMPLAKRTEQSHPGNGKHVPWQNKKFCPYCNDGFVGKQCKSNIYLH
jgi:hypothetical protein